MGDFLVYLFCLLRLDFFDELSRHSRPDGVGLYDRIREHKSICRHDSSFAHDGVIEHYGTHSYQSIIFDDGAVYHRIVPDRDEIAYMYLRLLVERVQHRTVLNIDVIAYANGVYIATEYCVEPYGAVVAHHYVAYDCGILCKEAVATHLRNDSPYCFY